MPTVLFLGASVSQLPAIRHARASGRRVVAVDGDPAAVGFADADVAEAVDFNELERVVEVGRRNGVDSVVAISSDRAVPVAAAVAERLGLPGIGVEVAKRMTDKAAMRACLREHGVPQPAFAIVGERDATFRRLGVGLPAVLKPVDSGGQRGVCIVTTEAEFAERLPHSLAHSRTRRGIVERFVDGAELNGIVVVRGGEPRLVTLSDRLRPPGPGFGVGWIHLFPSQLDAAALATAAEVAVRAVRALGLRDGIAFPQLLVTDEGEVLVVEVAARIPAGQMADLVRLGVGVDLVEIALRQAEGAAIPDELVERRFERPLAIRFLTASPGVLPPGRVLAVDGLDEVRAAQGVLEAGVYIQLGETISPVEVDADRRGYVIATADDPRAALELADAASRRLRVAVEHAAVA
ncbi:MAG: ATP-grasp domain-containing protein [Gaiellaceae bacterium]